MWCPGWDYHSWALMLSMGGGVEIRYLPAYEDGTECSETSAYKIQTPGNYLEYSCVYYTKAHTYRAVRKWTTVRSLQHSFSFRDGSTEYIVMLSKCHCQAICDAK